MGPETYQIKPLIGEKNYNVWKEEVKGLLSLDELWDIVKGEELRPLMLRLDQWTPLLR